MIVPLPSPAYPGTSRPTRPGCRAGSDRRQPHPRMKLTDCYNTLELEPGASLEEVKRAYRELAQVWHPDRFAGKPALQSRADAKLKEINVAYRELVRRLATGDADTATATADGDGKPSRRQSGPAAPDPRYHRSDRSSSASRAGGSASAADNRAPHGSRFDNSAARPTGASRPDVKPSPRAAGVLAVVRDRRLWLLLVAVAVVSAVGAMLLARRSAPDLHPLAMPPGDAPRFRLLAAGATHGCGVATDGRVFCWGADDAGQIGRAAPGTCSDGSGADYDCDPAPAQSGGTLRFRDVVVGLDHTCALTPDGGAYCWGAGYAGQIGDGGTAGRAAPAPVAGGLTFESLSALGQHTCGVATDGEAYCWGRDTDGQLGDPQALHLCRLGQIVFGCGLTPVHVDGGGTWLQVTAGASHSCGLAPDGAASCWGSDRSGQLGANSNEVCPDESGDNPCALRPMPVATSLRFRSITAGAAHTCAIAEDDRAYCWGRNDAGQLGTGSTTPADRPVPVAGDRRFNRLFAGGFHTCAVTGDGALWCWGQNAFGQLGASSRDVCRGIACSTRPVS